ncbi:MAG: carbon-nitrogen hydrolase family protein [Anaeromyxobacter sp.]
MARDTFLVAAAQLTSTEDRKRNLDTAVRLIGEAADLGAQLVALPENFSYMGPEPERLAGAEALEGPTLSAVREVARRRKVLVVAGSFSERTQDPRRTANTCALVGDDGELVAVYRKIHLFDVAIPDGARYAESEGVVPGAEVVVAETALARIGLTICYDLRFPELYRQLSERGAEVITIPAAFTLFTGKDHWEVLVRARAIENQAYVIAPAQVGKHSEKRTTFGNAMVVDPWGVVLARCPDGEGVCVGAFSRERLERIRRELPALQHRRL